MDEKMKALYLDIFEYAKAKNLTETLKALPWIRNLMCENEKGESQNPKYLDEYEHSLQVCMMLIDLHIQLTEREEDILLAAVLIHVYPENFHVKNLEEDLVDHNGFSHQIYEIVDTLIPGRNLSNEEQLLYFKRIQENKLSLLIALADRGNVVQQLYRFSSWDAHRYINETRARYYPMCIYGKENYYDLLAPISVLLEKMKSLIEVSEVLLRRYEVREAELIQDILALREENATIRGIIKKFSQENAQ